ncbi:MAG: lytic murein transglycosylase [Pseudomonadota bacterium]
MRGGTGVSRRAAGRILARGAAGLALAMATPGFVRRAGAQQATEFTAWLDGVRRDALARGISAGTLDSAFASLAYNYDVIALDRSQPESTITFADYLTRVVSDGRIQEGRALLAQYRPQVAEIGRRYGVQPRFIIALWGIESNYGRQQGDFRVVEALATLAFDGRRSDYFRQELMAALEILEHHDVTAGNMLGSWAGAMGQCQFMPSSYLRFAVDVDGDGRRDIWNSIPDVFGSIANYLAGYNWRADETWGREVRLPASLDPTLVSIDTEKPLEEWKRLGLRRTDGGELPVAALAASLIRPDGDSGPAFLVYPNYRAILKWNRSTYFATAVGTLADRLEQG